MKLLAVDTATQACSAALFLDGEVVEKFTLAPRQHTQLILPMIDTLMTDAGLMPEQLDAVAFGCGPGSFTGVRIATSIIHGIAFGADLPVVPVSTLAAIAQDYFNQGNEKRAFVAMDARMQEIFWGVYQKGQDGYACLSGEETVAPATEVIFPAIAGVGLGSGWKTYQAELMQRLAPWVVAVDADVLPKSAAIAQLGAAAYRSNKAVPVEQALPVYLRNKVAKKESER